MKKSNQRMEPKESAESDDCSLLDQSAERTIDVALTRIYSIYGSDLNKFFADTQQAVDLRPIKVKGMPAGSYSYLGD